MIIIRKQQKNQLYFQILLAKHEFLTGEQILTFYQHKLMNKVHLFFNHLNIYFKI